MTSDPSAAPSAAASEAPAVRVDPAVPAAVLETRGLTKRFGGLTATDDVSLSLHATGTSTVSAPNDPTSRRRHVMRRSCHAVRGTASPGRCGLSRSGR